MRRQYRSSYRSRSLFTSVKSCCLVKRRSPRSVRSQSSQLSWVSNVQGRGGQIPIVSVTTPQATDLLSLLYGHTPCHRLGTPLAIAIADLLGSLQTPALANQAMWHVTGEHFCGVTTKVTVLPALPVNRQHRFGACIRRPFSN